jgi:ABC-type sugar transport system ATPase subunit
LKILSGAYFADEGEIRIEGEIQNFKVPLDAARAGVSIIYQELNYLDELTVGENIFIGRLPKTRAGFVNWKKINRDATEVLEKHGVHIDPKKLIKKLTTAEKQLVEIVKAMSRKMKILVMDEPTAALNDEEVIHLVERIKQLAETGIGVVYISHRLEEVYMVSHKVMVLRDGEKIGEYQTDSTSRNQLVKAMVGREISEMYPKREIPIGDIIFEIKALNSSHLKEIDFTVRSGEILGVFGLMGSGRTKLCEALFGLSKVDSGHIFVEGKRVSVKSPADAKVKGLAYVPSERKTEGLIMMQTVRENFSTAILNKLKRIIFLNRSGEEDVAKKWIKDLEVVTPGVNTPIESLSGGNQQKVVLGKWLETGPNIIILNEPTRGVDVGAKVEIYAIIEDLCEQGMGVILISSEQPEILALSDRIVVMYAGRVTACLTKDEFSSETLLHYATGGS